VLIAVVLAAAGCQTLTEELPAQPETPPVQIPVLPPPIPVPSEVPVPQPGGGGAPPPQEPTGGGPPPGQVPTNQSPVVKVGAKVYFLECDGQQVPDSEFATKAQVGCRIHFDCTPKDAQNNPTQAQGPPSWTWSPGSLIAGGNPGDFTPTVTAKSPGNLSAWVVIDGVTSNTVNIQIVN
jgi:hypothetical protein